MTAPKLALVPMPPHPPRVSAQFLVPIDPLRLKFEQWLVENPDVMNWLVALARQARDAGRVRIGLRHLVEVCRWHVAVGQRKGEFKINNKYHRYLRDRLLAVAPDVAHMFEVRRRS